MQGEEEFIWGDYEPRKEHPKTGRAKKRKDGNFPDAGQETNKSSRNIFNEPDNWNEKLNKLWEQLDEPERESVKQSEENTRQHEISGDFDDGHNLQNIGASRKTIRSRKKRMKQRNRRKKATVETPYFSREFASAMLEQRQEAENRVEKKKEIPFDTNLVILRNVPIDMPASAISHFCRKYGEVERVKIIEGGASAIITYTTIDSVNRLVDVADKSLFYLTKNRIAVERLKPNRGVLHAKEDVPSIECCSFEIGNCSGFDTTILHHREINTGYMKLKFLGKKGRVELILSNTYRLSFLFGSIKVILINQTPFERLSYDNATLSLFFELEHPPLVYRSRGFKEVVEEKYWTKEDEWVRTTTWMSKKENDKLIGECFVYRFGVAEYWLQENKKQFEDFLFHLSSFNQPEDALLNIENSNFLGNTVCFRYHLQLPFSITYLIDCLYSQNIVVREDLGDEFFQNLLVLGENASYQALTMMVDEKRRIYNDPIETLFECNSFFNPNQPVFLTPEHHVKLRRAVVTPTRIICLPETVELANRVVRHFKDLSDRFLRVQFLDEDFRRLRNSENNSEQLLFERIAEVLKNGIKLPMSMRHYKYLAFSSSQLRDNCCWFFAPTEKVKVEDVLSWMGNLSEEMIIAKHAARMGQCFTSTVVGIPIKSHELSFLSDVKKNGYTYSDGCGTISYELAKATAMNLDLEEPPSVYQIRFAGAKGIVSIDPKIKGRKICIRPSMVKFSSDHHILEVIQTSKHSSCFLNRQIITIMDTLGVPFKNFKELQDEMLKHLELMYTSTTSLKHILAALGEHFVPFYQMVLSGISVQEDTYLKNIVSFLKYKLTEGLLDKARILVPSGRTALGTLDETGRLKYGQIYFQYSSPPAFRKIIGSTVLTGTVTVIRCPALHPGDVRMYEAVDIPELSHLKDCVVFPQEGPMPQPLELSGGDLDGDTYWISWDSKLQLNPEVANQQPMDFKGPEPKKSESPQVTLDEIKQFYVDYMRNDRLGLIAIAHLIHSDLQPQGAASPECLQLAQLHCIAVDYPKTGVRAEFPVHLRPRKYPHFVKAREFKKIYKSTSVLGRLYDDVLKREKLLDFKPTGKMQQELLVEGYQDYVQEAQQMYSTYCTEFGRIMSQYNVQYEAEIITGTLLTLPKRMLEKSRRIHIEKAMSESYRNLRTVYRKLFLEGLYDISEKEMNSTKKGKERMDDTTPVTSDLVPSTKIDPRNPTHRAKAASLYYVTNYHTIEEQSEEYENNIWSFPWIVEDVLNYIMKKKTKKIV